ncbi:hypothetical protein HN011_004714 [Eciton burchellii]|nr:hypothetical protein HN011_004714 [Eciton burchellii]
MIHFPTLDPCEFTEPRRETRQLCRPDGDTAQRCDRKTGGTVAWLSREETSRRGRITSAREDLGAVPRILQIFSSARMPVATAGLVYRHGKQSLIEPTNTSGFDACLSTRYH